MSQKLRGNLSKESMLSRTVRRAGVESITSFGQSEVPGDLNQAGERISRITPRRILRKWRW